MLFYFYLFYFFFFVVFYMPDVLDALGENCVKRKKERKLWISWSGHLSGLACSSFSHLCVWIFKTLGFAWRWTNFFRHPHRHGSGNIKISAQNSREITKKEIKIKWEIRICGAVIRKTKFHVHSLIIIYCLLHVYYRQSVSSFPPELSVTFFHLGLQTNKCEMLIWRAIFFSPPLEIQFFWFFKYQLKISQLPYLTACVDAQVFQPLFL